MIEMLDLSSNIHANDWVHSEEIGSLLKSHSDELYGVLEKDKCGHNQYTSLADLSHDERLSLINSWHIQTKDRPISVKDTLSVIGLCQPSTNIPQTIDTVIVENKYWKVVVPKRAVAQYETLILPTQHCNFGQKSNYIEKTALAKILAKLATRFDNLMMMSTGCEINWHGINNAAGSSYASYRPVTDPDVKETAQSRHLHMNKRYLEPEEVAAKLRDISDLHFKDIFAA